MVGLTPSQLLVMQILSERGEVSAGELSKMTQLKHATITTLVDKLVTMGAFVSAALRRGPSPRLANVVT